MFDALPLPKVGFEFNPGTLGLTQLPTWFWLTGVGPTVTVPLELDGYEVEASAWPSEYYWYLGDGSSGTTTTPGSASSPAVIHTYTVKGAFTVGVIVAYTGRYTFNGYGRTGAVSLGTVDQPEVTHPYGVQEIRSVLVPTATGQG